MKLLELIWTLLSLAQHLLLAHRAGIEVDEEKLSRLTLNDLVQRETFDDIVERLQRRTP